MDREDIISVLLESPIYLDIPLKERQVLVKYLLCRIEKEAAIGSREGEFYES
ncbi:MAG: hypothetical protein WC291_00045 [Thermodesulfovibrionales bacterium]|jgi:hypothetical protein